MNRRSIVALSAITALWLASTPGDAVAQRKTLKEQLVGTWSLVLCENVALDGAKTPLVVGSNPAGQHIFTNDGSARKVKRRAVKPTTAKAHPWRRRDGEIHQRGLLIGYARVSTLDQNLALQQDALTSAGCEKIFIEQMSGAVADRPGLHEALDYARSGDTLVVWKLDRLARSMKQLIETIEKLRLRRIGFRSLTESIDTTTAQGLLVFHMFSALAEFERSLIRERTRAGLAAAKRQGRTGGRPPKLTDDDLEAARALLANPDIGVTQIADRLGVSPATLYRYIPAARTANAPDG